MSTRDLAGELDQLRNQVLDLGDALVTLTTRTAAAEQRVTAAIEAMAIVAEVRQAAAEAKAPVLVLHQGGRS